MNAGRPFMKAEPFQKIHLLTNRIVYFRPPNWSIYFYVIALCLAYIVVTVHTPLTLYPDAAHDDGLFMSLGRSLAEGKWLGRYSQFTLMKGPGYPAFLALVFRHPWLTRCSDALRSYFSSLSRIVLSNPI